MSLLKARDLMVGDLINAGLLNIDIETGKRTNVVSKVLSVSIDDTIVISGDNNKPWIRSMYSIEPIPLTPEILEKNGFVYKEREETCATEEYHIWSLVNTSFFLDDDSWWRKEKDDILRLKFGISKIKFLHELQHALKLCGIEKEIEL